MYCHISIDIFCYLAEDTRTIAFDDVLNKKINNHAHSDVNLIVSCWFDFNIQFLLQMIEYLKSKNFNSIELILDSRLKFYIPKNLGILTTFINFIAITTDKVNSNQLTDLKKTHKGLILTGSKLERLNRIGLLKSLYDQKFLTSDNLIWTYNRECLNTHLFVDQQKFSMYKDINLAIEYFDKYSADKTNDIKEQIFETSMSFQNYKYVTNLYRQTSFSIIPETFFDNNEPTVTEKTYFSILNKHPFLIAGSCGVLAYLKSFGFHTFEQYFKNNDYDNITDHYSRLIAITENAIEFSEVLKKFKNKIEDDVEHNYQLLRTIIKQDTDLLNLIYKSKGLPVDQIDEKFNLNFKLNFKNGKELENSIAELENSASETIWMQKYNIVKGESWPEINSVHEFYKLPVHIQQECINNFNLLPIQQLKNAI